jgi:hypothetical protein
VSRVTRVVGTVDGDVRQVIEVPDRCQQFGCNAPATTWCPLCRCYLCAAHDQLTPIRKHDCLRGPAEARA